MSTYFKLGARIDGLATTPTAGGNTALSASSRPVQQFTGTLSQTITLPDATTLKIPRRFDILNRSTQQITVNNFGGALVATIPADSQRYFLVTDISTSNGVWQTAGVSSGGGGSTGVSASDKLNLLGGLAGLYADSDTLVSRIVKVNPEEVGGQTLLVKAPLLQQLAWPVGGVLNGYGYTIAGTDSGGLGTNVLYRYNDDNDFFLSRATLSSVKTNGAAFTLNGKLYAIGGHSSTGDSQVYDDVTNLWAAITAISTSQRVGQVGFALEYGYAAGGTDGATASANLSLYNDVTNQWYSRQPMSTAKVGGGLFMFDNIPHVHSGSTDSGAMSPVATMFIYNVASNSWRSGASRTTALAQSGSATSTSSGFVGGGYNASVSVATAEEYSNLSQKWSARRDIGLARHGLAGFSLNGSGYICGGRTIPANGYATNVEKYTNAAFYSFGIVKKSNAIPTSLLVAALTKDFSPNLLVQIRTDDSNWKNLTSGVDSAVKQGESISIKLTESHSLMVAGGGSPQIATSELHNPVTITWTSRASMITARGGGWQFPIDGYGYAGGAGTGAGTANERYHDITNVWASRTVSPAARDRTMSHNLNGYGYVYSTSGTNTNNQLKYNAALDSWSIPSSTYPTPNGYALGYSLAGFGYIIGGDNVGTTLTQNAQYNDVADVFVLKAAVHNVQQGASSPFEGLGYVHGGYNGGAISTVSSYNPSTNAWTARTSLVTAQFSMRGDYVYGYLYQMSGTASPTSVFRFNPSANTWSSSLTAMGSAREFPQVVMPGFFRNYEVRVGIPADYVGVGSAFWVSKNSVAAPSINREGIALGGFGYLANNAATYKFDPVANMYTAKQAPTGFGAAHNGGFSLTGYGYLCGEFNGTTTSTVVRVFNPTTETWISGTSLNSSQGTSARASLNDFGYITSGNNNLAYVGTNQRYSASTLSWTNRASSYAAEAVRNFVINGFFYINGGFNATWILTTSQYNDFADTWTTKANNLTGSYAQSGHNVGGKGLVTGGNITPSHAASAISELYNVDLNAWTAYLSMNTAKTTQGVFYLNDSYYTQDGSGNFDVLVPSVKNAVLGLALEIK